MMSDCHKTAKERQANLVQWWWWATKTNLIGWLRKIHNTLLNQKLHQNQAQGLQGQLLFPRVLLLASLSELHVASCKTSTSCHYVKHAKITKNSRDAKSDNPLDFSFRKESVIDRTLDWLMERHQCWQWQLQIMEDEMMTTVES